MDRLGAVHTPRAHGQSGILRSPSTPGTGSSVRFGMRKYETGEESVLSASQVSWTGGAARDDDQSASMQLSDTSEIDAQNVEQASVSVSMEESFTESFLKREVGDALVGLAASGPGASMSAAHAPTTPGRLETVDAPETVRAVRTVTVDLEGSTSPRHSPPRSWANRSGALARAERSREASPGGLDTGLDETSLEEVLSPVSGPSSPTVRGRAVSTSPAESPTAAAAAWLGREITGFQTIAKEGATEVPNEEPSEPSEEPIREPSGEPSDEPSEEPSDEPSDEPSAEPSAELDVEPSKEAPVAATDTPETALYPATPTSTNDAPSEPMPAAYAAHDLPKTPSTRPVGRRSTPAKANSSFGSSFTSWATPRTDLSGAPSPGTPQSPTSPSHWPGMYEYSYLTEKEELDAHDAGELVPYAVEELSSKLVSIASLGDVDAREVLATVAQLDRTHTERTIFLQHRLARSYRLSDLLKTNLQEAHDRIRLFETQLQRAMEDKSTLAEGPSTTHAELQKLAEELGQRLQLLPKADAALAPARDTERDQFEAEREALEADKAHLAAARRDLEIRLASTPHADEGVEDRIASAVAQARASFLRDAEASHAQERRAWEAERTALRAALAEQDGHASAPANEDALRTHLAEMEQALHTAETEASEAHESFQNRELELMEIQQALEEQNKELARKVHTSADAVLQLSAAKQEAEAELTATLHQYQKRIHTLEHDVAHRGLALLKLEKKKDKAVEEALHFSLALSAKEQELQMLKRGMQNTAPYWKMLAQRRALQPVSTNAERAKRSDAAKRLVQEKSPHVGLASTPYHTHTSTASFPSAATRPSSSLAELSTSTIGSVDLSYRPSLP